MKQFSLFILFLSLCLVGFTQQKLFYNLYYHINPKHELTTYKKILLISNTVPKAKVRMIKDAKKADYIVVLFDDLFPPFRTWSPNEIDSTILAEGIDSFIFLNIKTNNSVIPSFDSSLYLPSAKSPIFSMSSANSGSVSRLGSTTLDIFVLDRLHCNNEFVFYAYGTVKGDPVNAAHKTFYNLLNKFEKLGISHPPLDKE